MQGKGLSWRFLEDTCVMESPAAMADVAASLWTAKC